MYVYQLQLYQDFTDLLQSVGTGLIELFQFSPDITLGIWAIIFHEKKQTIKLKLTLMNQDHQQHYFEEKMGIFLSKIFEINANTDLFIPQFSFFV